MSVIDDIEAWRDITEGEKRGDGLDSDVHSAEVRKDIRNLLPRWKNNQSPRLHNSKGIFSAPLLLAQAEISTLVRPDI